MSDDVDDEVRWLAQHFEGDLLNGRIGRRGANELVAEWSGVARLNVCRDGTNARFIAADGADPREVDKVRRGSAQALLRHLNGAVALHGSSVAVSEGHAVAMIGAADSGKSTLAAYLCKRGGSFLADDVVALEETKVGFEVLSLEENYWLDVASRTALGFAEVSTREKIPVPAIAARQSVPLRAIAQLVFREVDEPRARVLEGIEAIAVLLPQVLRFVLDEPAHQRRELETLAHLVGSVSVVRIERGRRFDQLEKAADLLATLVR